MLNLAKPPMRCRCLGFYQHTRLISTSCYRARAFRSSMPKTESVMSNAKRGALVDVLDQSPIRLVSTRHEHDAAFMVHV
jgi:hypothetical protein